MSAKGTDKQNAATGQQWGNTYNAEGQTALNTVNPFLTNEMTNPQGFGQQTVNAMKTEGGQIAAGAAGQGKEGAILEAARTGNTAALPSIIDAAARNSMTGETNAALGTDLANAKLKQEQQQAGAAGEMGIYDTSTARALSSLGLSNQAAAQEQQALQGNIGLGLQAFQDVRSVPGFKF